MSGRRRWVKRPRRVIGIVLLAASFVIVAGYFASRHVIFVEYDGVLLLHAGREIFAGQGFGGWVADFYPPLYSILLGLGDLVWSGFQFGKLLSLSAMTGAIFVTYFVTRESAGSALAGLIAAGLLATNAAILTSAILVENNALDSALSSSAILLVALGSQQGISRRRALLIGVLVGLAALTRYQSLLLIPFSFAVALVTRDRHAPGWALSMGLGAGLVLAPWGLISLLQRGWPFANDNHLNVAAGVVGPPFLEFWWYKQPGYGGFLDILRQHPSEYLENFLGNIPLSFRSLFASAGTSSLLAIYATVSTLRSFFAGQRRRLELTLVAASLALILIISQVFILEHIYLTAVPFLAVLAAKHLVTLTRTKLTIGPFVLFLVSVAIWGIFDSPGGWLALGICVLPMSFNLAVESERQTVRMVAGGTAAVLILSLVAASTQLTPLVTDDSDGALTGSDAMLAILAQNDNIESCVVMATHPSYGLLSGAGFLQLPVYVDAPLHQVGTYDGLHPVVKEWAPKMPSSSEATKADYLVVDPHLGRQYPALIGSGGGSLPEGFNRVLLSDDVALYEIHRPGSQCFS